MNKLNEKYFSYILAGFVFFLYFNSLFNKYSFDDKLVTHIHPQVQSGIKGIPEIFSTYYITEFSKGLEYRPLTKATFAIEYEIFGENPFISHLFNVLLYCLSCFLLYRLTIFLFPQKGKLFSFLTVLLFAAHPTHTEVVSSLKNREEILAFLFCILSIIFFVIGTKKTNYYFFIPAEFFFLVSLFTKLISLPFLLIIPLCIYYTKGKSLKTPFIAFILLSLTTLAFFSGINYMLPDVYKREVFFIENPVISENSLGIIILNSLQTTWLYIKLYIFPYPLSFYYGYDVFPVAKSISPEIVVAFLLYGFMIIYSVLKIRQRNIIAFAFLFYLLNMSMYFNLVFPAPGIIADRALYVSSFGFSLLLSFFITRLSSVKMIVISVFLLVTASVKTIARNRNWKDNYTLMSKDIKHLQQSAKANMEFASLLKERWENESESMQKEQYAQKSIFHYRQSLNVKPNMAIPNNEIGEILFNHYGKQTEAKEYFRRAVQLLDSKAEYHFNLATAHAFLYEYENAEIHFLRTIQLEPNYTKALHNLFLVYMSQNKLVDAFKINSVLMEKIPNEVYPHFNFGKYYLAIEDTTKALMYFEKANEITPGNKELISFINSIKQIQ